MGVRAPEGIRWMSSEGVEGEEHAFQAETRQLLDIVTNSIYTEKEVFLRELISNASDSLEKLRHLQVLWCGCGGCREYMCVWCVRVTLRTCVDVLSSGVVGGQTTGAAITDPSLELGVSIRVDKEAQKIVIEDTGVGLTKQELIDNLGTIAKSGSKSFVTEVSTPHHSPLKHTTTPLSPSHSLYRRTVTRPSPTVLWDDGFP